MSGANLQVLSGAGKEEDSNGAGNLIVGYDETPGEQTGSNNVVLGTLKQSYSAYGSIVGGVENKDAGQYATVLGQENSTAGPLTSVTGGGDNTASGYFSSVTGGYLNVASNNKASVTGGTGNEAGGEYSSISGGGSNTDEAAAKSTRFSAVWTKNSPATTKSTRQLQ